MSRGFLLRKPGIGFSELGDCGAPRRFLVPLRSTPEYRFAMPCCLATRASLSYKFGPGCAKHATPLLFGEAPVPTLRDKIILQNSRVLNLLFKNTTPLSEGGDKKYHRGPFLDRGNSGAPKNTQNKRFRGRKVVLVYSAWAI